MKRAVVIICCLTMLSLTSCIVVTSEPGPRIERAIRPVLSTVAVRGPAYRSRRPNSSLTDRFARMLESSNLVERIVKRDAIYILESDIELEGTSGGKIAWNVFNAATVVLPFLGSPFLGTSKVTIECRAYERDRLLRVYRTSGLADWRLPGWWGLDNSIGDARSAAILAAGDVALSKIVVAIAADPPVSLSSP